MHLIIILQHNYSTNRRTLSTIAVRKEAEGILLCEAEDLPLVFLSLRQKSEIFATFLKEGGRDVGVRRMARCGGVRREARLGMRRVAWEWRFGG